MSGLRRHGFGFFELAAIGALGALGALGVLAGCVVGPRYKPPDVSVPASFDRGSHPPDASHDTDDAALAKWWEQFDDATLQSLIARGLGANLDLQSAASRIREAREGVIIAGTARWPSVDASGIGLRAHANSSPLMPGESLSLKEYSVGFDATWELDLFGGARHGVEAAKAQEEGAVWQYRDTSVSLSAEIASDYLSLRELQERRELLRTSVDRQQELLELAAARAKTGFVTDLDVNQQRTQLYSIAATIPELDAQETALIHALGVLLGQSPDALSEELRPVATPHSTPQPLPTGLPSELLRRRPDIRVAERRLAAATAAVGVSVADLYPKFDLLGLASFASSSLSNLISHRNLTTAALGRITWPVFSAGRTRANVRRSEEEQTQAYLAYQKAVLGALQDVEDSLARFAAAQDRLQSVEAQQKAAEGSLTIAGQQYSAGLVTYINVLQAESAALQAEQQTTAARQSTSRDLVAIYKALGGGWSDGPSQGPTTE